MNIINKIILMSDSAPLDPAIIQLDQQYEIEKIFNYREIIQAAYTLANVLKNKHQSGQSVGIVMGNSPSWVISDLALMLADLVEIPVPLAFSAEQASFLLSTCQVILTDEVGVQRLAQWKDSDYVFPSQEMAIHVNALLSESFLSDGCSFAPESDDRVIKVIHTSGTTSNPKGVRIRSHGLNDLVNSLWERAHEGDYQRYLNLVPLSLLIEQVTAIYMPLTSGGCILMPSEQMRPIGDPSVTAQQRLPLIEKAQPSAMTLTPSLVEALAVKARGYELFEERVQALFGRDSVPLLAAGGAPISKALLLELQEMDIPVYQGYGLSENSSVVSWNYRKANRIGTVGQPLSHVQVKIAEDGELCIQSSSLFAGYSNHHDPSCCDLDEQGWLHTGDLATMDEQGFISIVGRKKTMIITANGRNISPEWLESSYRTIPCIIEAIVFGDEQQFLSGIFFYDARVDSESAKQAIHDYARQHLNQIEQISNPILVPHSKDAISKLFTVTGRPRREHVPQFITQL